MKTPIYDVDFGLIYEKMFKSKVSHKNIVVLAQVHCLPSTLELFKQIQRRANIHDKSRIIIVPKPYSAIAEVVKEMDDIGYQVFERNVPFQRGYYDNSMVDLSYDACLAAVRQCDLIRNSGQTPRLIIVDDGGFITHRWWKLELFAYEIQVVSIQQTRSGIDREPHFASNPQTDSLIKIDVARSAAKRFFESRVVCQGVINKIEDMGYFDQKNKMGIIGLGWVGKSLAGALISAGFHVSYFDIEPDKNILGGNRKESGIKVVECSDIIFGCTGQNALVKHVDEIFALRSSKKFISCSSRDVEFLGLLQSRYCCAGASGGSPYDAVQCGREGAVHFIENGGFPINFDRETEWENEREIALTRGLVLGAILQAIWLPYGPNSRKKIKKIMVAPEAQQKLVRHWLSITGKKSDDFFVSEEKLSSLIWWREQSGGEWPY